MSCKALCLITNSSAGSHRCYKTHNRREDEVVFVFFLHLILIVCYNQKWYESIKTWILYNNYANYILCVSKGEFWVGFYCTDFLIGFPDETKTIWKTNEDCGKMGGAWPKLSGRVCRRRSMMHNTTQRHVAAFHSPNEQLGPSLFHLESLLFP